MKTFNQLGVSEPDLKLQGEKINMFNVINSKIIVHNYTLANSKFDKGNGKCLHIQIEFGGSKRVLFSGSGCLMNQLEQVNKNDFPFEATIVKENNILKFT